MARSPVDKYEQILAADPGSLVFVDLARALIERGEGQRAADVCKTGVTHHPTSIAGLVTWGRALLALGQASEAMGRFEQAIAIDRTNPYAYNLIGELLVQKGLHRSALPLVEKAAALQPADEKVRGWLETTRRALGIIVTERTEDLPLVTGIQTAEPTDGSLGMEWDGEGTQYPGWREGAPPRGLPATAAPDPGASADATMAVDVAALAAASQPPQLPAAGEAPGSDATMAIDMVALGMMPGLAPASPPAEAREAEVAPPGPSTEKLWGPALPPAPPPLPVAPAAVSMPPAAVPIDPFAAVGGEAFADQDSTRAVDMVAIAAAAGHPLDTRREMEKSSFFLIPGIDGPAPVVVDPFHALGDLPAGEDGDSTRAMDLAALAASDSARAEQMLQGPPPLPGPRRDTSDPRMEMRPPGELPAIRRESSDPRVEVRPPGELPATRRDASDPRMEVRPPGGPPVLRPVGRVIPPPLRHAQVRTGALEHILSDLPPDPEPQAAPPPAHPPEDPHEVAAAYEKSLRVELDSIPPVPVMRSRRVLLTIVVASAAALISAGVAWIFLRSARETDEIIAAARNALSRDTYAAYRASARALDEVLASDPANMEARALDGLVLARLSMTYGTGDADRTRAAKILADPKLMNVDPEVVLAGRHALAQGDDRKVVGDDILARPTVGAGPLLHSLAGAVLLARKEPGKAIERFNAAMAAAPGHVPTLVRVGDYYRTRGDHPEALRYYGLALTISEDHPGALLGSATSRLDAGEGGNLQEALTSLGKLADENQVPVRDRLRLPLVRGRLLGALGKKDDALAQLATAAPRVRTPRNARDLAAAYVEIGALDKAQVVLETAMPRFPKSAKLREAYGRVLLGRDDLAAVIAMDGTKGERGLQVVRGIALFRAGRNREARAALRSASSEAGKLPVEAVVYLALIDLQGGDFDKAHANLERLARTASARAVTRWAYAQVLLAANRPDEAERDLKAALEADPHYFEAHCGLGRLLLERGRIDEAVTELTAAVNQNPFHVEGQVALVNALLRKGDAQTASRQVQALLGVASTDPRTLLAHAAVLLASGEDGEARVQAQQAVQLAPRSGEARVLLARAMFTGGDVAEAVSALEAGAKALPRDVEVRVALGEAQLHRGDAKKAKDTFEAALKLSRSSAAARVGRAESLAALKNVKDAEKDLRAALGATRPPAAEATLRAGLAGILADQGKDRAQDAEQEAARALGLDASSAAAHLARGRALALLGRDPEATSELRQALDLSTSVRVSSRATQALEKLGASASR